MSVNLLTAYYQKIYSQKREEGDHMMMYKTMRKRTKTATRACVAMNHQFLGTVWVNFCVSTSSIYSNLALCLCLAHKISVQSKQVAFSAISDLHLLDTKEEDLLDTNLSLEY